MDEELSIIDTKTRNEKIQNFLVQNKKLIILSITVAIIAYVFRQPLMHMAHPASNELMMNYVGKKNQELISALSSSLWSASWFISAKIFEWLRILEFQYFEIFLITATLYIMGVILFGLWLTGVYMLIRPYYV